HQERGEIQISPLRLRQPGSGWCWAGCSISLVALLGFPPLVFATVALIDLLYQFWVHTRQVGRLGWFDCWFCPCPAPEARNAVTTATWTRTTAASS
ncbi:MAG: hypothetical protein IPJ08_18340, partial [Burkholderiales bacterium]|nr:hypothetical protein [Burkholderiales bacterium]